MFIITDLLLVLVDIDNLELATGVLGAGLEHLGELLLVGLDRGTCRKDQESVTQPPWKSISGLCLEISLSPTVIDFYSVLLQYTWLWKLRSGKYNIR